jgi:hypothetical protein
MSEVCPRCGSNKIMPDLPVCVDVWTHAGPGSGSAIVSLGAIPGAWTNKGAVRGALIVTVCGECGHAEMQVSNFRKVYERHQQVSRS